ncbi:protein phosphatase 2C domain-containing protein [Glycomyces endophyticus]|uniref:Protein phosphatase 2C domain-containing protein n=1 Tax=Glycomyces endophyticus TaxID=480996 RepID=A0ABN2HJ55_9ACTN
MVEARAVGWEARTRPGSAAPNEDLHLVGDHWALVLDGITRYPDDGCVHDVPWYAAALGAAAADRIGGPHGLAAVLADAIAAVNARHCATCDLANPVSPGATVAMVRWRADLEWLVLGDCAIVRRDRDGGVGVETDGRLAALPGVPAVDVAGVRRWPVEHVARVRNREGGFWVASTDPAAAAMARTGALPLADTADLLLCTDGLTRLVDRYGHSWTELAALAFDRGIDAALNLVRGHGDRDERPRAKRHDDATAVHLRFPEFASL